MARTSSGKYWFLASHSKTCHLQVWAQSCQKNTAKCAILEIVQPMSKANVPGCWFYDILKNSMILSLVPDAPHRTMSLGQFGFWCGHCQNQFSEILIFSNPCKNISFAGLGPELSQKQTKFAILEIVQLVSKANVAGCWFFDILKNSMILRSGARCDL